MLETLLIAGGVILATLLVGAAGLALAVWYFFPSEPAEPPLSAQFEPGNIKALPYAIRLSGEAFRWHDPDRIETAAATFPKMFEDGPWKWEKQYRFAGKDFNCGHYFGLSREAAAEEAAHYAIDMSRSVLIKIEFESNRILDLTHPSYIKRIFEAHIDNHELVSWSYYSMLSELIERGNGGTNITDWIGLSAERAGYSGIMFFSARTMEELGVWSWNRNLEDLFVDMEFRDLRATKRHLNVMFFSGVELVASTRSFRVGDGEEVANPYFARDRAEILSVLEFGEDYQESRRPIPRGEASYQLVEALRSRK